MFRLQLRRLSSGRVTLLQTVFWLDWSYMSRLAVICCVWCLKMTPYQVAKISTLEKQGLVQAETRQKSDSILRH
jgi:hypothetical protein